MNQVMPFNFQSQDVRAVIGENGEPWFIAKDVCDILGYENSRDTIQKHCKYPKLLKSSESLLLEIGPRGMTIINEADLYRLVIRSTKPAAQKFEQWVMEEVLPSIRKKGSFTAGTSKFDVLIAALQGMKELEEKQNRQLAIQAEQQKQLDSLSEKVNQTAGGTGYYSIVAYARKVGLRVSTETAKTLGKQAAKMSRKHGFDIGKVADERWGTIGTYHSSILERVFPKPL